MRIAIDARYLSNEFTGIGYYSEHLAKHLIPSDPDNQYSVFVHESFERDLDLPDNAEVIPYHARPMSLNTLYEFGRAVNETGADLLHSFFPVTPQFLRIPSIVTVHDLQALRVPAFTGGRVYPVRKAYDLFYRWVYPSAIRRANYLISVSHATKLDVGRLNPQALAKTIVIYSGVDKSVGDRVGRADLQASREKYNLPPKFVLYLGSTRPNKNLPTMIRAFHRMQERFEETRDCYFVLVVNPDRFFEESHRLITKLRLQKRMRVYNQISELEKRCFYRMASGLFFVTKNEGFGIPLLEAQCAGLPVLAADHASLPEIANGTALLADPDDPTQIARRLRRLLTDDKLRERLIADGKENIERFSWNKAADAVREMYHHLF